MSAVLIRIGDLADPALVAMLQDHLVELRVVSPPESCHVLDVDELADPSITILAAYDGPELLGCVALKRHDGELGELKSMRTATAARGRGVATAMLHAVEDLARQDGLRRISLETGTEPFFAPARALYEKHGYVDCPPFGDYGLDPLSIYFSKSMETVEL